MSGSIFNKPAEPAKCKAPSAAIAAPKDGKGAAAAPKDGKSPPTGPSTGAPPVVLSPGEDYLTKLLIRPEVLKGITSELCQVDMRNLSLASKATHRLVEYTCGKPPTQVLSTYTCSTERSGICWACNIKVCMCCVTPVVGYYIPRPAKPNAGKAAGHKVANVAETKRKHKSKNLCEDCSKQSTEKVNEIRRQRMGEDDGKYFWICSDSCRGAKGKECAGKNAVAS